MFSASAILSVEGGSWVRDSFGLDRRLYVFFFISTLLGLLGYCQVDWQTRGSEKGALNEL